MLEFKPGIKARNTLKRGTRATSNSQKLFEYNWWSWTIVPGLKTALNTPNTHMYGLKLLELGGLAEYCLLNLLTINGGHIVKTCSICSPSKVVVLNRCKRCCKQGNGLKSTKKRISGQRHSEHSKRWCWSFQTNKNDQKKYGNPHSLCKTFRCVHNRSYSVFSQRPLDQQLSRSTVVAVYLSSRDKSLRTTQNHL